MPELTHLPYNFRRLDDNFVISNYAGQHQYLSEGDFTNICKSDFEKLDSETLSSIESKSFVSPIDEVELRQRILSSKLATRIYSSLQPPGLFMVVPTLRCDHDCNYCQVSRADYNAQGYDLDEKYINDIIKHIDFFSKDYAKVEFQGGEPLINFEFIKRFVSEAKITLKDKDVSFVIATALGPITDEIIEWVDKEKIDLSISIDGDEVLHNTNRPSKRINSFVNTQHTIRKIRSFYPNVSLSALSTVTRLSLEKPQAIVDTFLDLGFRDMFVRPLSPYGFAVDTWRKLGYSSDEFFEFYKELLDIIVNYDGELIEYNALLHLNRIFKQSNSHVDLKSPAGLIFGAMVFDYSGDIFGSDESRMLYKTTGSEELILGNVSKNPKDLIKNKNLIAMLKDSFIEVNPGCCDCAYNQYCGADPIYHLSAQGDLIGDKSKSFFCDLEIKMFDYIFTKYYSDELYYRKFNEWLMMS